MLIKSMLIALFSTCCLTAHGQIAPIMVNQPGSPIQFVSVTSTLSDLMDSIEVKNTSNKRVSSFQIGLVVSIPAPCAATSVYGDQQLFRVDKVNVEPGQEKTTEHYLLFPTTINNFDKSGMAGAIFGQIAITSVTYSDGSTWQNTRSGHTYNDKQVNAAAVVLCSNDQASIDIRAKSKAACEARRKGALIDVGFGYPGSLGFTCENLPGYGCAVGGAGTSCTSSFCSVDNPWCQNQVCHTPGTPPIIPPTGVKMLTKPETAIPQELAAAGSSGQSPSK